MRNFSLLGLAAQLVATLLLASAARAQTLPAAEWAVACGGGPATYPWAPASLAFDGVGNTFVTGNFAGTITLGSTTLSATQT